MRPRRHLIHSATAQQKSKCSIRNSDFVHSNGKPWIRWALVVMVCSGSNYISHELPKDAQLCIYVPVCFHFHVCNWIVQHGTSEGRTFDNIQLQCIFCTVRLLLCNVVCFIGTSTRDGTSDCKAIVQSKSEADSQAQARTIRSQFLS